MFPQLDRGRFPDIEGILEAIDATTARLSPRSYHDHERKYEANSEDKTMPYRTLQFQSLLFDLTGSQNIFSVEINEKFAGVDECFEFYGNPGKASVLMYRLRFGSNRSCRLTIKRRQNGGDNTEREHVDLPLGYKNYEKQRTSLVWMAEVAYAYKHSLIGQSGDFWFVHDKEHNKLVEIVLYKVGRAEKAATSPLKLFVEIAPRACADVAEATHIIEKYEKLLHLSGRRVEKSNMELFDDM